MLIIIKLKYYLNLKTNLNYTEKSLIELGRAIQNNNKYLDEAQKSADGTAKSIDEFGNKIEDADKKTGRTE